MSRPIYRRRKVAAAAAVLAAVALLATACGGGSPADDGSGGATGDAERGGTLTLVSASNPVSLDPSQQNFDPFNPWLVTLAYDSLLAIDESGEIVPSLAKSFEVSDDNTSITLTLTDGVTFADGTPLDAAAVVASFTYWQKGRYAPAWNLVDATAEAVDDLTVKISTPAPHPMLARVLTPQFMAGAIISPAGLADPKALATTTYGSGPYTLDESASVVNDHYSFTANEDYWNKEDYQYFDKVDVRVITTATTAVQSLQADQADVIATDFTVAQSAEDGDAKLYMTPSRLGGVALLDRTGELVPALADPKVRQALNLAVDRDALVDGLFGKFGERNDQMGTKLYSDTYDPELEGYWDYDPERAKELLAEAGYADGFTIPLNTIKSLGIDQITAVVAEYWNEIGVKTEITTASDPGTWSQDSLSKKYAATGFTYSIQPQYLLSRFWFSDTPTNFNAWGLTDERLNDLLTQAEASSGEDQTALYREAQALVVQDAFEVPVVQINTVFAANPDLQGITVSENVSFLDPRTIHY